MEPTTCAPKAAGSLGSRSPSVTRAQSPGAAGAILLGISVPTDRGPVFDRGRVFASAAPLKRGTAENATTVKCVAAIAIGSGGVR